MTNDLAPALHDDHGRLSRQESMFLDAMMLDPTTPEKAAEIAGFSPPEAACWRLLADKRIRRALYERRQALLESTVAIQGIRAMGDLLSDPKVTPAVKAKVAKDAIEAAKHLGAAAFQIEESGGDSHFDLADMTSQELQELMRLVDHAKAEVETRKKMPDREKRQDGLIRL